MRRLGGPVLGALLLACGEPPVPRIEASLPAPSGRPLARVGEWVLSEASVVQVALHRKVNPREALEMTVHDALLAQAAREDLGPRESHNHQQRVLARAMLRTLWLEIRKQPVTDAELAAATLGRWVELDRPPSYLTVHAVVQIKADVAPQQRERARAVAAQLRSAVEPAARLARGEPQASVTEEQIVRGLRADADPAQLRFIKLAKELDTGGFKLTAEALPPVTEAGWVVSKGYPPVPRFDPAFAGAAARLGERGSLSEVVESPFGFHVILLLAVVPERRRPRTERLAQLRSSIWVARARRRRSELIEQASVAAPPTIKRNADALLAQLPPPK